MSFQLFLLDRLFRLTMKRQFRRNPDVLGLRVMMSRATRFAAPIPRRILRDKLDLGGVWVERLATATADASRAILYLHGGGMVAGSPSTHRALTWRLADGVGVPVYAVDYRLAPEHPFPAALDDVVTAYRGLLGRGISEGRIIVGGDSAGGNLTLAMSLDLKRLGIPEPAALVALSPATDLFESFASFVTNARADAVFDARTFPTVIAHYCPSGDPEDPRISPLRGDVSGLPPTLFQCSEDEMLLDATLHMAKRMKAAGVDVTLQSWPKVFHVWQLAADVLPEARRAIDDIVAFMTARLHPR
jgi:monoterpene epsilon-lactone hydrolase